MIRITLAFALSAILLTATPLDKSDWRNVVGLPIGEKVHVTRTNQTKMKAEFVSATADSLTIRNKTGEIIIPKAEVRRVGQPARSKRGRHAAIGAGIGATAAATVVAVAVRGAGWDFYTWIAFAIGVASWAGIGALIGVLIPSVPAIYEVPAN